MPHKTKAAIENMVEACQRQTHAASHAQAWHPV